MVLGRRILGVVGTPIRYAWPVELGRRPGGRMPPVEPIADWAVAQLGIEREEARGVAFAIARKIAREGTEGAGMFRAGLEAAEPEMTAALRRGVARIASWLAGEGVLR